MIGAYMISIQRRAPKSTVYMVVSESLYSPVRAHMPTSRNPLSSMLLLWVERRIQERNTPSGVGLYPMFYPQEDQRYPKRRMRAQAFSLLPLVTWA